MTAGRRKLDAWNVWYRSSTDGGAHLVGAVKISDVTSGAAYKTAAGFGELYGDYGEIAITHTGKTIAIWGEGESYTRPRRGLVQPPDLRVSRRSPRSRCSTPALPAHDARRAGVLALERQEPDRRLRLGLDLRLARLVAAPGARSTNPPPSTRLRSSS